MAMKLSFDLQGNAEQPTFVLARRNGVKIGKLTNLSSVRVKGDMSRPEISFEVHKYSGKEITPYWDQIKDFKLVWCKEWDTWFEIKINSNYSSDVTKSVNLTILGAAELSETKIYGMEINTENDILRDDYVQPTLFYNEDKPSASLMHRLLDKTPHYKVRHIDEHLKGIQRVFSFNDRKLSECFEEVAEELDVLFVFNSDSNFYGKPNREISVYDLKNYCNVCGARGSFVGSCLNCGSTNVTGGYGQDTTIFVNREGLGEEITVTVNQDEVKNCFRLEAGDDLMTATIRNCNPNGTSYMWEPGTNIEDMDPELQELLWNYNKDFSYYRDEHVTSTAALPVGVYNAVVKKYEGASEEINPTTISNNLVGYSPIMQHYYDAVDMEVFLQSGLLPSLVLQETTAVDEAAKLTAAKLSPVAVIDSKYMTLANASTAVLNAAKIAADPRYKIVVKQSSLTGNTWTGNFTVTNFSDERDSWDSDIINVIVNDDYETYVKQKLRKSLYNGTKGKYGRVAQMIDMSDAEFQAQLKNYNLVALNSINTCFTECLNILSEQGIDKEDAELYSAVYTPISSKIGYIQSEVQVRETEINVMRNMQSQLLELKKAVNDKLDLESYLGAYWLDFCAYRREETYSNSNYISDYLTNKQLFDLANEFIDLADYELHKVATYTHEITSTLKNLLVIPEFKPLLDYFECGNWIRIQDDEGEIYKLRLLDYEIDFENLQTLSVTFSEVSRTIDGLSPVREILVNSSNIINNYNAAMNKTNSNFESINDSMKDVVVDNEFNNVFTYDSYYDVKDNLTQTEKKIYSDIDVTDTAIRTYVGDVERTLYGEITQTATEIRAEVKDADDGLASTITQTASQIRSEVKDADDGLSSRITQNADKISTEITDRQNADKQLSSSITQTASQIKAEVAETYETIEVVQEKHELAIETSKGYTNSQIKVTSDNINLSVDEKINTTTQYFDDTLTKYSTTAQMNAAIDVKADQITQSVSETYSTKLELADGIESANDATDEKLKSYSTTTEMNSAIDQKANSINLSVDEKITETKTYAETVADTAEDNAKSDTAEKLKSYSTTTEMNSAIDIKANQITQTVSETYYTKSDAGTEIKVLSSRIEQTATGISMKVNNGDTSSGITITMTKEDGTTTDATGTIEMTGLVKFTDLSGSGTTTIDGSNIKTGTIDAERINTDGLVVGMSNLPSDIATTGDIPTKVSELTNDSGYKDATGVTTIVNGTVTTDYVEALNIKVKAAQITDTLTIGQLPDTVAEAGDIPTAVSQLTNDSGYQNATGVTTIVNGTVTTDYVNALGITVAAANITGTLTASQIDATNLKVNAANIEGGLLIGQLPDTVAEVGDIPTKVSQLNNDKNYQDYAGVVSIANGVITADKIVAGLGTFTGIVTIGSLESQNIIVDGGISCYAVNGVDIKALKATVDELEAGGCSCDLSDYALVGHNHNGTYAYYSHSHSEYALYGHSHSEYLTSSDLSDLSNRVTDLENGSGGDCSCDLSNYVTNDSLSTTLSAYAKSENLSNFVTNGQLTTTLSSYATTSDLTSAISSVNSNLMNQINSLSTRVSALEKYH